MRQRSKEAQKARDLAKEKKALATALATQAAAKEKKGNSVTNNAKRNIVASQASNLRAKRNSIAQHSKRNSVLLHPASQPAALRGKRNSMANMLKPVPANTQRSSNGGMMAAMKSIRGSVAGDDSDADSDDDWDSD